MNNSNNLANSSGSNNSDQDILKENGGKWNKNLTIDNEKISGWIFSIKKKSQIKKLLNLK